MSVFRRCRRLRAQVVRGALYELNIDSLCANSNQAKGRVELGLWRHRILETDVTQIGEKPCLSGNGTT